MESKFPEVLESLTRAGGIFKNAKVTNPRQILQLSRLKLQDMGIAPCEIELLKKEAARAIAGDFVSVSNLSESKFSDHISFGCSAFDDITNGGIATLGVTEICGESGAGKTQILLQLSLMVQLPRNLGGLSRGAVFICTEDAFPSKRLSQMIDGITKRYPKMEIKFRNGIFIEHILDAKNLLKCVELRLPNLMRTESIGLIIIDSVAAVFRTETNIMARAYDMRKLVDKLLSLADSHQCAVICVNQVSSMPDNSGDTKLTPCLGLAWANLIRTRIQIKRSNVASSSFETSSGIKRTFEVIFCPDVPNASVDFCITQNGVQNT